MVVVGRNNFAKSSRALEQLVKDLQSLGLAVHGFESAHTQTSRRMNDWFESLRGGAVAAYCRRLKLVTEFIHCCLSNAGSLQPEALP